MAKTSLYCEHPVDAYGRHLTAGNIQDYANVDPNWVVNLLFYANQNTVPGILMDVQGHTYPVTCINTWDMFQKLANDPAAFARFQRANQVPISQNSITEQNFAAIASQGHDFGDITHYAHFSQNTIINGIRSAMAKNLPGMLIHLGPQKIHVACYFVWEKLLQKAKRTQHKPQSLFRYFTAHARSDYTRNPKRVEPSQGYLSKNR